MTKQTIFLGNQANDGTGDSLRVAFDKVNDNFTELYDHTGSDGSSIGDTHTNVTVNENGTVTILTTGTGTQISDSLQDGKPDFLTVNEGSPLSHGFDSDGMWVTGNAGENGYPLCTTDPIPAGKKVVVEFDFVYNENCSDHGVCVFKDGVVPNWSWGPNNTRIGAQWNCGSPEIDGLTNSIGGSEGDGILTATNTYHARFVYSPVAGSVSLETFDLEGTLLRKLELNDRLEDGDYYIGFSADQDVDTDPPTKSYFSNLSITVGYIGQAEWAFDKEGNLTLPGDGGILDQHGNALNAQVDLAGAVFDTWSNGQIRLRPINQDDSILVQSSGNGRSALRWHIRTDPMDGPSTYSQVIVDDAGIRLTNADWSNTRGGNVYDWNFNWEGNLVLPPNGDIKDSNGNSAFAVKPLTTDGKPGGALLSISTGYPNYGVGGGNACFATNVWTGNGTFSDIQVGDIVSNSDGWQAPITQIGIYGDGWLSVDGDFGNNPSATYTVTGQNITQTQLDLTKSVQKLTDGDYRVHDGQEGQIMYLVLQPNTNDAAAIRVFFDNARVAINQYTDIFMNPFAGNNIVTLIFTDGCWQSDVGTWD